ncbi:MAG TPA: 30S ribosomal protein S4e [Candidatus Nanoarchaeia archaeon]|nr:30S ribosomal protein S4e [Candidatus Nanoarchaeia archaeon]
MKNHLKLIAAPRTWFMPRKTNVFTIRPNPGAHSLEYGLPLGLLLRDELKLASTTAEVRKIVTQKEVLVDGVARTDHRFMVGLFDVLSVPKLKKQYRMLLDKKGRLSLKEINAKEAALKLARVVGKTALKGGKIQFNLHDGRNLVSDAKAKVGDTFVISLPAVSVTKILPVKKGSKVFLIKGKHAGDVGVLKEIKGMEATYTVDGADIDTAKDYLFVVGDKDSEITLA